MVNVIPLFKFIQDMKNYKLLSSTKINDYTTIINNLFQNNLMAKIQRSKNGILKWKNGRKWIENLMPSKIKLISNKKVVD